jgi:hypothetical protein
LKLVYKYRVQKLEFMLVLLVKVFHGIFMAKKFFFKFCIPDNTT